MSTKSKKEMTDLAIGQQAKHLRIKKGLSVEDCALELGISVISYSDLEQGKQRLSAAQLFLLSQLFNLPISSFFDRIARL